MIAGYQKTYPLLPLEVVEQHAKDLFRKADLDGNGEIDYSEWEIATIDKYSLLSDDKI